MADNKTTSNVILGIDLGTTNSVMAYMEAGKPKVIPSAQGSNLIPSVVAQTDDGQILVGYPAKNQAVLNPSNTIFAVKRLIGRRFNDPVVQKAKKTLPYEIREGKKGEVEVKMGDKWYKPEEISAKVLAKIKQDAEEYFGHPVTQAVITVPAYFDDSQRQATKNAGRIAGFEVKRILNEPTAAALAYGLDKQKEGIIAVFDLGGGTFDITILDVGDGVFEVLSTNGDTFLGGEDWDQRILEHIVEWYKAKEGIDLTQDKAALQRLKEAAEKAKIELSQTQETTINLPYITATKEGPKHLVYKLTRAELEKLTKDLIDRVEEPVKKALEDAKIKPEEVTDIILVGGMTRMPAIRKKVEELFGKKPKTDLNPDEVVAMGAAVQAGILTGDVKDITLLDVTPLSLGVEVLGGLVEVMIPRNTTIPTEKKKVFTTAADNQPAVEVHIVQGERPMAKDNKSLGRFILDGIPPAPRGVPKIEVTFSIDANGILNVSAKDLATNKEQKITITASTSLDEKEVEKLIEEAKKHAEEDKKRKELIELRNKADTLTFTAEKLITDLKDKISEADKKELQEKIDAVRDILKEADLDKLKDKATDLKAKHDELEKKLQEIGAKAYQAGASATGAGTAGGTAGVGGTNSANDSNKQNSKDSDKPKGDVIEGKKADDEDDKK